MSTTKPAAAEKKSADEHQARLKGLGKINAGGSYIVKDGKAALKSTEKGEE